MFQALKEMLVPRQTRLNDRYDADELRYKYGEHARAKAVERAHATGLSARERRHWQRVSQLLR